MNAQSPHTQKTAEICASANNSDKMVIGNNLRTSAQDSASERPTSEADNFSGEYLQGHEINPRANGSALPECSGPCDQERQAVTMKDHHQHDELETKGTLQAMISAAPKPSVGIDIEKYQAWLDDPDLTDTQKKQIIEALWSIMVAFVDLGFGVHPLQAAQGQEVCGQLSEALDPRGDEDSNEASPAHQTLSAEFNAASDVP